MGSMHTATLPCLSAMSRTLVLLAVFTAHPCSFANCIAATIELVIRKACILVLQEDLGARVGVWGNPLRHQPKGYETFVQPMGHCSHTSIRTVGNIIQEV